MSPVFYASRIESVDSLGQYVLELFTHGADCFLGGFPVDTGVGYRHAVLQVCQVFRNRLVAPVDVAFHHQALDRLVAFQDLVGNVLHDQRLDGRVFTGVGVAAVHHDGLAQIGFLQRLLTQGNVHRIVVGLTTATAQYYVTVVVALGADDGAFTLLVDTQEAMRMGDRFHGVNSNVQAVVGEGGVCAMYRRDSVRFMVCIGSMCRG